MNFPNFLFALALLAPSFAFAEADQADYICPRPETFKNQIYNCGQNEVAATIAKTCEKKLMDKATQTAKNLAAQMQLVQKALVGHQKESVDAAYAQLLLAIASLEDMRDELADNTDLLASYTDAMIDFADAKDAASSADCFNSAFDQIQGIVDHLDEQTGLLENARVQATALAATSKTRSTDFSSAAGSASGVATGKQAEPVTQAPAKKKAGSTITGVEEDQAKKKK